MEPPPAYEEKPEEQRAGSSTQSVSITIPPTQPAPPQYNEALNASTTPPVGTGPPVFPIYLQQPDSREEEYRGMERLVIQIMRSTLMQPMIDHDCENSRDLLDCIWKLMIVIGGTLALLICVAVVAVWISFSMIR